MPSKPKNPTISYESMVKPVIHKRVSNAISKGDKSCFFSCTKNTDFEKLLTKYKLTYTYEDEENRYKVSGFL